MEAQVVQIIEWVDKDLTVVKIADLLARRGVQVPYRTLHQFCVERAGIPRSRRTRHGAHQ